MGLKRNWIVAIVAIFTLTSLEAQPVLTADNFTPKVGDIFNGAYFDAEGISPGVQGQDVSWNFSNLVDLNTGTFKVEWLDPTTTAEGNLFPEANFVAHTDDSYVYWKASEEKYTNYGNSGGGVTISYTDPAERMEYPFKYGIGIYDDYAGTFEKDGITFHRNGSLEIFADGYGTLVLPDAIYENALRVRIIDVHKDSAIIANNPTIFEGNYTYYFWYTPDVSNPLMVLYDGVYGAQPVNGGSYLTGEVTSVLSIQEAAAVDSDVKLYPNPAKDVLEISFESTSDQGIAEISVIDLTGKVLQKSSFGLQSGIVNQRLDISNLPSGFYFVRLQEGDRNVVRKLEVLH